MPYTLYIDESGNSGINKVASESEAGATPYLVLGAVLINDNERENIRQLLESLAHELSPKSDGRIHCNKINHKNQVYLNRQIDKRAKFLSFSVISKKDTLGGYKDK